VSLLHAEYTKVSRRKMFPVMVGILCFLMAFIAILFYLIIPALPESAGGGVPPPQRPEAFLYGAQQVAGQGWWVAVILVTAMFGGEVAGTAWATALTRHSSKTGHIAAKLAVYGLASWLAFLAGTALWSVVTFLAADGSGSPALTEWLELLWKFLAVSVAWTSIGLGAVAMTRSIAVAMGVALGVSFVDSIVAPFVEVYENVSLTAATNGIFGVGGDGPFSEFIPGGDMSIPHALAVMAGWALVGLLLTAWGLARRDA
jgi:hypothetical protein